MALNTSPSFNAPATGAITTSFGSLDIGRSIFIQSDGKILVAGSATIENVNDFALVRYNVDGTLDTSFGNQGKLTTDFIGTHDYGRSVVQQTDGKIIVTGFNFNFGNSRIVVARYNIDGSLDTSYDSDGKLFAFNGNFDDGGFATIQPDGKLLLAASDGSNQIILQRLNENGTVDTSFGVNGQVTTSFSGDPTAISTQPDGKIVLLGNSNLGNYILARYNTDGSLDTSLNSSGFITSNISSNTPPYNRDEGNGLAIQADGKIVVAGRSLTSGTGNGSGTTDSNYDFTVARYNTDGSLDTSFSADGKVIISISAGADFGSSVAVQADGKLVVAGYNFNPTKNASIFTLMRFNIDGSLDTSFSGDGIVTQSFTNLSDQAFNVKVQDDGKILVAGTSGFDFTNGDFALVRYNSNGSIDTTFGPTYTLNNTASYVEDAAPVVLDNTIQIYDAELSGLNAGSGNYSGASITLSRQGGANAQDVFSGSGSLSFSGSNAILAGITIGSVSNTNGTLIITFNNNATQARVNQTLSAIAYSNTSDLPPASVQINWALNDGNTGAQGDGGALSTTGSTIVNITAVNDAPIVNVTIPNLNTTTNNFFNYALPANTFTDVNGDAISYSATLSNGSPLPAWLTFNSLTRTFSGIPNLGGILDIRVTATDTFLAKGSDVFTLNVSSPQLPAGTNMNIQFNNWQLISLSNFNAALNTSVAAHDSLIQQSDVVTLTIMSSTSNTTAQGFDPFTGRNYVFIGNNFTDDTPYLRYTSLEYSNAFNTFRYSSPSPGVTIDLDTGEVSGAFNKLELTEGLTSYQFLGTFNVGVDFNTELPILTGGTATSFTHNSNGNVLNVTGNLVIGADGSILSGTVTSFLFTDSSGNKLGIPSISMTWADFDSLTDPATHTNLNDFYNFVTSATRLAGNDVIVADATDTANDNINGFAGNDILNGGGGNDTLIGGTGADTLDSGTGADTMTGGDGNDIYIVDSTGDTVTESNALAAGGIDLVKSSVDFTLGANIENLTLIGLDNLIGTGNQLNNVITGNAGVSFLDGGSGKDTLIGGGGTDFYTVDLVKSGTSAILEDTIIENLNESLGDLITLRAGDLGLTTASTITLQANIENLEGSLTGLNKLNFTGNNLNNFIQGNQTDNIIDGGTGADVMLGSTGNDTYIVDSIDDFPSEIVGGGIDLVKVKTATIGGTYVFHAEIEDATLINTVAYNLTGNELNNTLIGNAAVNTLIGGFGNDTLDGGIGADALNGGDGDDIYIVDNALDSISEAVLNGSDLVRSSVSHTLSENVENLTLTGVAAINATGSSGNNTLTGNAAANILNGGGGADTLLGGAGNDTYILDQFNDVVTEGLNAGTDLVQVNITNFVGNYTLTDNVENATLTNTTDYQITGNALNNVITGNAGANTLDGAAGNDTLLGGDGVDNLTGGAGIDALTGGKGNDTYNIDLVRASALATSTVALQDTVSELANPLNSTVEGIDTINLTNLAGNAGAPTDFSNITNATTLTVNASIENFNASQTGTTKLNITGNTLENIITGNAADNILDGGLNDGKRDTLEGGTGNDTYIVDIIPTTTGTAPAPIVVTGATLQDVITENTGEGNTDTLRLRGSVIIPAATAASNIALAGALANIENLDISLTGTTRLNITGNAENNILTGNAAVNTLIGGFGNDTLDGGLGADTLDGGDGDDRYVIDNVLDVIQDSSGNDTAEIRLTTGTYALAAGSDIENVILAGVAAINATGNAGSNTLTGNAAANILNGNGGSDTLIGGDGNDTYIVDSADDVIIETNALAAGGIDLVQSSVDFDLSNNSGQNIRNNIENLTLTGAAALGTGNALNNIITGNAGANTLDGKAGADFLNGGLGDDTYIVDLIKPTPASTTVALQDTVTEALNAGTDNIILRGGTISTTATTLLTLGANIEGLDARGDNATTGTGTTKLNITGNTLDNTIRGNDAYNIIDGGIGNDFLRAYNGNDTLLGGAGADTLDGDDGNDILDGGAGVDQLQGDQGDDTYIIDIIASGTGVNTTAVLEDNIFGDAVGVDTLKLRGSITTTNTSIINLGQIIQFVGDSNRYSIENADATLTGTTKLDFIGSNQDNNITGNAANNNITGEVGNDTLSGLAGNDTLSGGIGNDILDGGIGTDTMDGGEGNDTYVLDVIADTIINETGTSGTDTARVAFTANLSDAKFNNIENLILTGAALNGTGNGLVNDITGNDGANTLDGGLDSVADTLRGGKGNDIYIVRAGDTVIENLNEGSDLIRTALSFDLLLANNVENLTLLNVSNLGNIDPLNNINAFGNDLANTLTGNDGDNAFIGAAGADTLIGGKGNDRYNVNLKLTGIQGTASAVVSLEDTIVESALVTDGLEDALSLVSTFNLTNASTITLAAGLEYLLAENTGSTLLNLTGNSANNIIQGNDAANVIDGAAGTDTLIGFKGNDTYIVDIIATGTGLQDVIFEEFGTNGSSDGNDTLRLRGNLVIPLTLSPLTYDLNFIGNGNLENIDTSLTGTTRINLTGNSENNTLTGNAANNTLNGGTGDDTLIGGLGADTMIGGAGADTYYVDNINDVVDESGDINNNDAVFSSISYTIGATADIEGLTLTGVAAINGTGNDAVNFINGNSAANILIGGGNVDYLSGLAGADTLDGGTDADEMTGGDGNDTYIVDDAGDIVRELNANTAIGGIDLVRSSVTFDLSDNTNTNLRTNVENLTLTGMGNINGIGNALNNVITGNAGNNTLNGDAGNDTLLGGDGVDVLTGGAGIDALTGGKGNDTYNIDLIRANALATSTIALQDTVNELPNNIVEGESDAIILTNIAGNAGAPTDFSNIINATTLTVNANVENFNASGTGNIKLNITGNTLKNTIIGNSADNVLLDSTGEDRLEGRAGNDSLDGGLGRDRLIGGTDNDTYLVDIIATTTGVAPSPIVVTGATLQDDIEEFNGTTDGIDTLKLRGSVIIPAATAATDITLTGALANIENLDVSLTGTTKLNLIGNDAENILIGNAAANFLLGGEGNNTLDGGAGADTLLGGSGNDTLIVDNIGDIAQGYTGDDTIRSTITIDLESFFGGTSNFKYEGVENVTLIGTAAINVIGNSSNNKLFGNDAANIFAVATGIGYGGTDTMDGGKGADTYIVDSSDDIVSELFTLAQGGGVDLVKSFASFTLGNNIDNLTLQNVDVINPTSFDDINGTGNDLANSLIGNWGMNILDGKAGADTMAGGANNDTYYVDNIGDVVIENASTVQVYSGIDTVNSEISYVLGANLENLTLIDDEDINGTGNTLVNTIRGNAGDNVLDGGVSTTIVDTLIGGTGNDTYVVDLTVSGTGDATSFTIQDIFTEQAGEGTDTLRLRGALGYLTTKTLFVNDYAAQGIEGLDVSLTGSAKINITGNTLDNILIGNAFTNTLIGDVGNDTLDGGAGADTLNGGAGDDTYFVDVIKPATLAGGDVIIEDSIQVNFGNDTVNTTFSADLNSSQFDGIENLTLLATAINATGDAGDNELIGNASANIINGGAGNDEITGGSGNDTLTGGLGVDTFVWELADKGANGAPRVDRITDFSLTNDKLDLRDLLVGESSGNILNFLDVTTSTVAGVTNTEIRISNTGGFTSGSYSAAAENQHITLAGVNLLSGTNETDLLANLIAQNKLIIDV